MTTGGLWGIYDFFFKFLKCCYSHFLWPSVCHSLFPPLIGPLAAENSFARCFALPFYSHRHARQFWKTYSKSSWSDSSNHTSISWAEKLLFKDAKTARKELPGARNWQKHLGSFSAALNNDSSAQGQENWGPGWWVMTIWHLFGSKPVINMLNHTQWRLGFKIFQLALFSPHFYYYLTDARLCAICSISLKVSWNT